MNQHRESSWTKSVATFFFEPRGAETIAVIRMPFPECAIDVDRPADLVLATQILERRAVRASRP